MSSDFEEFKPYEEEVRRGLMSDATTSTADCLDDLMRLGFSSRLLKWWEKTQGPLAQLYDFVQKQLGKGSSVEEVLNWFKTADEALVQAEDEVQTEVTPAVEAAPEGPRLKTISLIELMQKDIPPTRFFVEGLIPAGLTILASPPKFGKSWFALDLCFSVATGRPFLGYSTNKAACLYLALEDTEERLQGRFAKLLNGSAAPEGVDVTIDAFDLDHGLLEALEAYLLGHPSTGVVVIDTLQKVRGAAHGREGAYAADYREAGRLKAFADAHGVAVVLIHHLRKQADDGDVFDRISGTNGLMGAADTAIVLTRSSRDAKETNFNVTGRDIEPIDGVLQFDSQTCRWKNLGALDLYLERQEREVYDRDPIVMTIKKLLAQSPKGWSGTASQLLTAGTYFTGKELATSARDLSSKLQRLAPLLLKYDGIAHERDSNGSGGGKHTLEYQVATVPP